MMKSNDLSRCRVFTTRALACAFALHALSGCAGDFNGGAGPEATPAIESQSSALEQAAPLETETETMKTWRKSMARTPLPKPTGCFHAAYPGGWVEVPCGPPLKRPMIPRRVGGQTPTGSGAQTVGNGNDMEAQVSGTIAMVESSFPKVTGVTSETDPSSGLANDYSLQMNSNLFSSPNCSGAANPSLCKGWEQFIYQNTGNSNPGLVYIQSWLITYGKTTCPSGFTSYNNFGDLECYNNSSVTTTPSQPITNLAKLSLTGQAAFGGSGSDTSMLSTGDGNLYAASGNDSLLTLSTGWNTVEFNIVGDGNGSAANFNAGSTIVAEDDVTLTNLTPGAPTCANGGTTAETNNLSLVTSSCCPVSGTATILFTESNVTGQTAQLCTNTAEDNYYREKTCSIPSSAGLGGQPNVTLVSNGNIYLGTGFQPAMGDDQATWTNLGHGSAAPKSSPSSATVLDSSGVANIAVVYTGTDNKVYETHQVSGGAFSAWSSATYSGFASYAAIGLVGGQNPSQSYQSTDMLLVGLDPAFKVHALLSNGHGVISGWKAAPSRVFLGAVSAYTDQNNEYYVVGIDSTTKTPYTIHYSHSSQNFTGSWSAEPGSTTFGTGVSASNSTDPNSGEDTVVLLGANASNKTTPWADTLDLTTHTSSASALTGTFDSAPSAGNSLGCSAGGCGNEPILVIHGHDTSCYWHDARTLTGEWTLIGHP